MRLQTGFVVTPFGQVMGHRTHLKIMLNPILRLFGWEIGSLFDGRKHLGYRLHRCQRERPKFAWKYQLPPGWRIVKELDG